MIYFSGETYNGRRLNSVNILAYREGTGSFDTDPRFRSPRYFVNLYTQPLRKIPVTYGTILRNTYTGD